MDSQETVGISPGLFHDQIGQVLVYCLYLFGGLIVLMAVAFWLRRWWRSDAMGSATGFTLDQLRKLRKAGKMSEEEFKRTNFVVSQVLKSKHLAPPPAAKSKTPPPPTK